MGFNLTCAKVSTLCHQQHGDFGKTVMLGRQVLTGRNLQPVNEFLDGQYSGYIEQLLMDKFGATEVDSIDNSDFEGANIVCDLSEMIDEKLISKYDTVMDLGTLEHVYNINMGFTNTSLLCKPGGRIIHVLPANNWLGHGFWQISPEVYDRLYTEDNGYKDTNIFFSDVTNNFFKQITQGNYVNTSSGTLSSCYTTKVSDTFSDKEVYQKGYVQQWR